MSPPDASTKDPLQAAVRLLAARSRSRVELARGLARRGFDEEAISRALAAADRLGYLHDPQVALARATALLRDRRLSPEGVRARLVSQGFDGAAIERALAEAIATLEYQPETAARAILAARKLEGATLAERRRAARLLASRGFDEALISRLLALDSTDEAG